MSQVDSIGGSARDLHAFTIRFLQSNRSPSELVLGGDQEGFEAVMCMIIQGGPDRAMAMTDPALYKKLRNRITELHLGGW